MFEMDVSHWSEDPSRSTFSESRLRRTPGQCSRGMQARASRTSGTASSARFDYASLGESRVYAVVTVTGPEPALERVEAAYHAWLNDGPPRVRR